MIRQRFCDVFVALSASKDRPEPAHIRRLICQSYGSYYLVKQVNLLDFANNCPLVWSPLCDIICDPSIAHGQVLIQNWIESHAPKPSSIKRLIDELVQRKASLAHLTPTSVLRFVDNVPYEYWSESALEYLAPLTAKSIGYSSMLCNKLRVMHVHQIMQGKNAQRSELDFDILADVWKTAFLTYLHEYRCAHTSSADASDYRCAHTSSADASDYRCAHTSSADASDYRCAHTSSADASDYRCAIFKTLPLEIIPHLPHDWLEILYGADLDDWQAELVAENFSQALYAGLLSLSYARDCRVTMTPKLRALVDRED